MVGDPRSWSKLWEALDREIGESGKNRGQIAAHREFQPAAGFHDRENCRNLGSRLWTADVNPVLAAQCHLNQPVIRPGAASAVRLGAKAIHQRCVFIRDNLAIRGEW